MNSTMATQIKFCNHIESGQIYTHTHLKELLDDIISKDIHHELVGRLQYLTEDKLALRWTGSLQFQLDKPLRDREDEPDILY